MNGKDAENGKAADNAARGPVRLYAVIVALYAVLMGWWVYFFATEGDRLMASIHASGATLDAAAEQAVHDSAASAMRMFLFEGSFLGLLVLGSIWLVVRALNQQIAFNMKQRNFLSAVTHELRTPLASARLYLETILLGRADEEHTARYLRHAKEDLDRLTDRVDDVLLARRLSEDRLELDREPVDVAALVSRSVERLALMHAEQGLQLRLDAPAGQWASADPKALDQILDNLVSNAAKYGADGGCIEVGVATRGQKLSLTVRDRGRGLRGADPSELVAPFVRGVEEHVRTRPGVGLGLFIVRELVRAHDGRLVVEDGLEGGGTRVTVELPRTAEPGADDDAPAPPGQPASARHEVAHER